MANKGKDLVSVIIPIYNMSELMDGMVRSILQQTYSNLEIILVDDGSTDDSLAKCREYEKSDNRIKVYTKKNGGLSSARNFGLNKINGKYFVIVDPDDSMEKNYVEGLYKGIMSPGIELSVCNYYRKDHNKTFCREIQDGVFLVEELFDSIIDDRYIGGFTWNKMYSSEVLKRQNLKFIDGLSLFEDLLFLLDYLKDVKKIACTNEKLYSYTIRDDSLSHKTSTAESIRFLKLLEQEIKKSFKAYTEKMLGRIVRLYLEYGMKMAVTGEVNGEERSKLLDGFDDMLEFVDGKVDVPDYRRLKMVVGMPRFYFARRKLFSVIGGRKNG